MTVIKTIDRKISMCGGFGGPKQNLLEKAEKALNENIEEMQNKGYYVKDIKINHYTTDRHNNGGFDEVWVSYLIIFEEQE